MNTGLCSKKIVTTKTEECSGENVHRDSSIINHSESALYRVYNLYSSRDRNLRLTASN